MKYGDIVEFTTRKGLVKGPIFNSKWSRRGTRLAKELNMMIGKNVVPTHGREVFEVADFRNNCIWTITDAKAIGKANNEELVKAKQLKRDIKVGNAKAKAEVRSRNYKRSEENSLLGLAPGDTIEVKYRDLGWKAETFSHFTSSGKVAFRANNRRGVRYAWPRFVRRRAK